MAIGAAFGVAFTLALSEGAQRPSLLEGVGVVAAYMVVMTAVCLLACVVPTRRALRIEPTEALAAE